MEINEYRMFLTRFGLADSHWTLLEYNRLLREGVNPVYDDVFAYERSGRVVVNVGYHYKRKKCNHLIKSVEFEFLADGSTSWSDAYSGDFSGLRACRCTIVDVKGRVFKKVVFTADLNTKNPAKFTMLMKTAESQCLSMAFPEILNGIHTEEEIRAYGVDMNLKEKVKMEFLSELVDRYGVDDEFKSKAVELLKNGVEPKRAEKIAERYLCDLQKTLLEANVWDDLVSGKKYKLLVEKTLDVITDCMVDKFSEKAEKEFASDYESESNEAFNPESENDEFDVLDEGFQSSQNNPF